MIHTMHQRERRWHSICMHLRTAGWQPHALASCVCFACFGVWCQGHCSCGELLVPQGVHGSFQYKPESFEVPLVSDAPDYGFELKTISQQQLHTDRSNALISKRHRAVLSKLLSIFEPRRLAQRSDRWRALEFADISSKVTETAEPNSMFIRLDVDHSDQLHNLMLSFLWPTQSAVLLSTESAQFKLIARSKFTVSTLSRRKTYWGISWLQIIIMMGHSELNYIDLHLKGSDPALTGNHSQRVVSLAITARCC